MRIPGACCVWVFLCGSGSRFQFRVRDFRPRTQKVFCGQEFCGFKLTFRFCNFLDVNFILFGSFLPKNLKFFAEVFCRRKIYFGFCRSFLPKKLNLFWFWPIHIFYRGKHVLILTISMQTWRFLLKRVWSAGAPRFFAPARTPQKPQIFGRDIFAVLLYNTKASNYCLIAPPPIISYLSYLI